MDDENLLDNKELTVKVLELERRVAELEKKKSRRKE